VVDSSPVLGVGEWKLGCLGAESAVVDGEDEAGRFAEGARRFPGGGLLGRRAARRRR
jgi:hypothetical protein